MGQYSIESAGFKTTCVYCKKVADFHDSPDSPLIHHLKNAKGCPLFKLAYLKARKALCSGFPDQLSEKDEEYVSRKFIQLNITGEDLFFCMRCGSNDLKHMCDGSIQKITENIDLNSAQFYIKYLNGDYINQINTYISEEGFELNKEQKELLKYLLEINKVTVPIAETLSEFLEGCSEKIFRDLEKKMKAIENDAVDGMYNESMILT